VPRLVGRAAGARRSARRGIILLTTLQEACLLKCGNTMVACNDQQGLGVEFAHVSLRTGDCSTRRAVVWHDPGRARQAWRSDMRRHFNNKPTRTTQDAERCLSVPSQGVSGVASVFFWLEPGTGGGRRPKIALPTGPRHPEVHQTRGGN
jgi:hypothetical protein